LYRLDTVIYTVRRRLVELGLMLHKV